MLIQDKMPFSFPSGRMSGWLCVLAAWIIVLPCSSGLFQAKPVPSRLSSVFGGRALRKTFIRLAYLLVTARALGSRS